MTAPRKTRPKSAPEGYAPPAVIEGLRPLVHGEIPVAFLLLGEVRGWATLPTVPRVGDFMDLDGTGDLRGEFLVKAVRWAYAPLDEHFDAFGPRWYAALVLEEV